MKDYWFPRSLTMTADPKIQQLGIDHGPAVVLAYEELIALAKNGAANGYVSTTYGVLGRRAFITVPKARTVVAALNEATLILLDEEVTDKTRFAADIVGWDRWQLSRDPTNARRQALFRNAPLKEAIRLRDGDECRYCGRKVEWTNRRGPAGGTYDHVDPTGKNTMENLVVACRGCNASKGHRTPAEAEMDLRREPNPIQNGFKSDLLHREREEKKENREPPLPPKGGRARDKALYEQNVADYAAWLLPAAPEPDRTQAVGMALSWVRGRVQGPVADTHVLMWLRQHAPDLVPEENAA